MSVLTVKPAVTGSVGATSAPLVATNRGRRSITVVNTHASQFLHINLATAEGVAPTAVVGSSHIFLGPNGGSWTETQYAGAAAIIGSGAGTTYSLLEF